MENSANAVLDYVWALPRGESKFVTVILPETFRRRSRERRRCRTTFSLKVRLLAEAGVVICDVPVLAAEVASPEPARVVGRVLVSGAHAASQRAVNYALSLGLPDTTALFFAFDTDEANAMRREWHFADPGLPYRS